MGSASVSKHVETDANRAIRWWLYALCLLIFIMIVVGGATRLTDSGLSITEWKPILGIIPPLGEADWQDAFAKYKQIPEYRLVNKGMSLAEFKFIFWWEWAHRFLGRMIGFAFLLPFLFFWFTGRIGKGLMPKLVIMFVLGGLQGALGWYMVASGLVNRVDVSQYRLAAHLCAAILIFCYILWVALSSRPVRGHEIEPARLIMISAGGLAGLVFIQIALGAFVAGLDAGMGYNTWPLMDGALIPEGLGAMSPWYVNLFENALTVQFNHRMAAYVVIVWAVLHSWRVIAHGSEGPYARTAGVLLLTVVAQMGLGIWTLVGQVPIAPALLHQGGAVVVLGVALIHLHQLVSASRATAS